MIPDLAQSLSGHDLRHLQNIAELWGIELEAVDFREALHELIPSLLTHELFEETVEILPERPRQALADLLENGGQLPWASFTRSYGEIRQMGRGRRDRELPHRSPATAAEMLWYRALVGRAFFDAPDGPQEFAYLPVEFQPLLAAIENPFAEPRPSGSPGRRARKEEYAVPEPASDRILDHACTLLAGARLGLDDETIRRHLTIPIEPLRALLRALDLFDTNGLPRPEETKEFLQMDRGQGVLLLFQAWRSSRAIVDLRFVTHLELDGEWEHDPLRGREAVMAFISRLPAGTWWNLGAFIESVRLETPDFQRPAGDYDSWFVRHRETGEYLRGFDSWNLVDGAFIYYMLTGPLHWLGIVDLAYPEDGDIPTAFRLSRMSESIVNGLPPERLPEEDGQVTVRSNGELAVAPRVARATRYQIARFSAWEEIKRDDYRYRLTGQSLERARDQGLRAGPILALLT
ncbi:MAG: hypothetical protein R3335_00330, partial [Anaerolineales bacterium]|nr:hypothetical protein [Anaerolineales bacterium]